MVVNKRKKVVKYRGQTTHGGGSRKKRRGAGSRGGRGRAGTGKRAGHRKAQLGAIPGRHGFLPRRSVVKVKSINLHYFTTQRLTKLVNEGKIKKDGNLFIIDLPVLGYQKLLGTGTVSVKLKITVPYYSSGAAEKVERAGGEIVSLQRAKEESPESS